MALRALYFLPTARLNKLRTLHRISSVTLCARMSNCASVLPHFCVRVCVCVHAEQSVSLMYLNREVFPPTRHRNLSSLSALTHANASGLHGPHIQ